MTDPITFNPYLGWVDVTDPANIPADVRIISAADLVRYETFGRDGAARLNTLTVFMDAAPTTYAAKSVETTKADAADLSAHTGNTANPHAVTKAQVGLGNADNTADTAKPVSTAQQAALDKLAKGLVAIAQATTPSYSNTGQQIILNIPSFTFAAGRWYEIAWSAGVSNSTGAANSALSQIFTASTADTATDITNLTELMGYNIISPAANVTTRVNAVRKIKYDTTTTLQIKAALNGNGSSYRAEGGPTYPMQLSITDLGLSGTA